MNMNMKKLGSK